MVIALNGAVSSIKIITRITITLNPVTSATIGECLSFNIADKAITFNGCGPVHSDIRIYIGLIQFTNLDTFSGETYHLTEVGNGCFVTSLAEKNVTNLRSVKSRLGRRYRDHLVVWFG